jgi:hypothetical protein
MKVLNFEQKNVLIQKFFALRNNFHKLKKQIVMILKFRKYYYK